MIEIIGDKVRQPAFHLEGLRGLRIDDGEHLAVVGPNGGGKSALVGILTQAHPMVGDGVVYCFDGVVHHRAYGLVRHITFRDSYGTDDAEYYYQQRYHSFDVEGRRTVGDELGALCDDPILAKLYDRFRIAELMNKPLILLSSGEMRKFQLAKALESLPRVLIVESPFIGLDVVSRGALQELLAEVAASGGVQVVLVLARDEEVPPFVTHVLPVMQRGVGRKVSLAQYLAQPKAPMERGVLDRALAGVASLATRSFTSCDPSLVSPAAPPPISPSSPPPVVEMHGVGIRYGDKQILRDVSLTIRRGEVWALSGDNGSGKSTLLSLICADNPQSYACPISLWGRKRGTGESIWEIKRRIGYVSPELQRSYLRSLPAIDVVASGLNDTVGLYKKIHDEQRRMSLFWMELFGIDHLASRDFLQLSSGEMRMVLLARAFVKDPELLILDEPLHGLDEANRRLVIAVIEAFTARPDRTAILVTHYAEELPSTVSHRLHLVKP